MILIHLILRLSISAVSKYPAIRYSCDELCIRQYAEKYDPMLHSIALNYASAMFVESIDSDAILATLKIQLALVT